MSEVLRRLVGDDLKQIAGALRVGRLCPPFSAVALQRYSAQETAPAVACELERLSTEGMKTEHLALFLETLAADRKNRAQLTDLVELVSTGPEAPGVANRDTRIVVMELFSSAQRSVTVAGYAVYQGRRVFQALAERLDAAPEIRARLFLDVRRNPSDTSKDGDLLARFAHRFKSQEWPGRRFPEVFYDPRALNVDNAKRASLHAKCLVVDGKCAFVSSANFTEAAQVRNLEIGLLVRSESIACRLSNHFDALVEAGLLKRIPGL